MREYGGKFNPRLAGKKASIEELYRLNYIKEVFLDSETAVAVVSGLPQMTRETYIIRPEEIVKTRMEVNELSGSRRVIAHGTMSPELGAQGIDAMRAQAEKLKIEAWKGYPGQPLGPNGAGWWMDDEKVGYPALELSRKLKIKNICAHKGLPAPGFSAEHCHPKDIMKAAIDFPDLNFLVYHAGFRGIDEELLKAMESGFTTSSAVPWVTELCEWKKKNPKVQNVYMELGATFGMTVITFPLLTAHMLGMMIDAFGADHVLWGTDSIWWGSPQWQIEAFKRLEMPEPLAKRFGYAPLTAEVKRQILGLNAARVYGVDPAALVKPVPSDYVDRLRKTYKESGPRRSEPHPVRLGAATRGRGLARARTRAEASRPRIGVDEGPGRERDPARDEHPPLHRGQKEDADERGRDRNDRSAGQAQRLRSRGQPAAKDRHGETGPEIRHEPRDDGDEGELLGHAEGSRPDRMDRGVGRDEAQRQSALRQDRDVGRPEARMDPREDPWEAAARGEGVQESRPRQDHPVVRAEHGYRGAQSQEHASRRVP